MSYKKKVIKLLTDIRGVLTLQTPGANEEPPLEASARGSKRLKKNRDSREKAQIWITRQRNQSEDLIVPRSSAAPELPLSAWLKLAWLELDLEPQLNDEKLVLVVDDDPCLRRSMSMLLHSKGCSVLQAENGQEALDVLKKAPHPPCLVVLDLAMPVMDGRRFLELRAQDPILRDIPVVVVSGSIESGESLVGIDAYLCKPVNIDVLIDIIDQHYYDLAAPPTLRGHFSVR